MSDLEISPMVTALEAIKPYAGYSWTIDGHSVDLDYDGEPGDGEGLRVNAMFAFGRIIEPGRVQFVSLDDLPITLLAEKLYKSIMSDGDAPDVDASYDGESGDVLAAQWPTAEHLAEGTAKMVRESIRTFAGDAADAVGGANSFGLLNEVATNIAGNFDPPQLKNHRNLGCALRESLKWLLIGKAVAAAKKRVDMEGEFDYLLGSFWLGNPVVGIGTNGKLLVVCE